MRRLSAGIGNAAAERMGRELSVAPMMDWTTRHQRYFARLLTRRTVLYTEMVVDQTLIHREKDGLDEWLGHDKVEHPVVLQLGGNTTEYMAYSAELGERWGYDEININVGCPSNRVCGNEFGAKLMLKPDLVREMLVAMQRRVQIPVTVKCRLGVDDQDSYEFAKDFVARIPECDHFLVHARKCLLNGISPHANRTIPPLRYERVFKLCDDFPDKKFTLNGGLTSAAQVRDAFAQQPRLYGAMIGRAAYNNPVLLPQLEHEIFGETFGFGLTRRSVAEQYTEYCVRMQEQGFSTHELLKPLAHIAFGLPRNKLFRTTLFQASKRKEDRIDDILQLVHDALEMLPAELLDAPLLSERANEAAAAPNAAPAKVAAAVDPPAAVDSPAAVDPPAADPPLASEVNAAEAGDSEAPSKSVEAKGAM